MVLESSYKKEEKLDREDGFESSRSLGELAPSEGYYEGELRY